MCQVSSKQAKMLLVGVTVFACLAAPTVGLAAPRWCSPFETEEGQPVTDGQLAGPVENVVGAPGSAAGSDSNLDPLIYIAHGQFTPAIPAAIDPAGQAAGFAVSTPDDRGTGINTNLRSDLAEQITMEGYFYMGSAEIVTAPSYVGRRLGTQKRGATDDSSRLAVGIHAKLTGVVDGLFDYEGFDYTGTAIHDQAGGIGWIGAWINNNGDFTHLTDDGVSLDSNAFPFTPVGSRISGVGGAAVRNLSRPINMDEAGAVTYFSTLYSRGATGASSAADIQFQFQTSGGTIGFRIGNGSNGKFFVGLGSSTANLQYGAGAGFPVQPDTTYFLVAKVVSAATGSDQAFIKIYGPDDTVPATEPETWDISASLAVTSTLSRLRINVGTNNTNGQIDEMRVGSTWEAVTDPDAPLGDSGEFKNVLSTYWAEEVPAEPPALPTYINHLELGTTPLEANTWYHFAMTYDGSALRWYLDGQQEGEVLKPPITAPGTAKMVMANNRMTGANDRGFYGVLDELRIWNRALAPNELTVNGGGPGNGLLWRTRFETQFGQPVTSGLLADQVNCFDNALGAPDGSPAGIVAVVYAGYGTSGAPAVPAAIDPAGLTGSFALSMPDLPIPAIETNIPSNTGDFTTALTTQGYFNSFRTIPVAATAVGSRLVSTMRSSSQGQARLAIGLAPNADVGATHNVLAIIWGDADSVLTVVPGTTPITPNTWYHFALVYDGTDLRFYLNGQQEGEVLAPNLIAPGTGTIVVGNDRTVGATRGFYGLLDKVVVSDHALAPTEFMTAGLDPCLGKWCNVPFADYDNDDDVDMIDFAALQRCQTMGVGAVSPLCVCFDRDGNGAGDGDLDLLDVEEFMKCATGPGVVWAAGLAPDCQP